MLRTIRMIVIGRVQGVFYRESSKNKAIEYGLCGTVQNLDDGTVEIHASGPDEQLDQFTKWCKKGPVAASVEDITVTELNYQEFDSFRVIRG